MFNRCCVQIYSIGGSHTVTTIFDSIIGLEIDPVWSGFPSQSY